jgi:hypothetical protein
MKKEEIDSKNAVIAEFMGLTVNPHDGGCTWGKNVVKIKGVICAEQWLRLLYNVSFDALYPVLIRIESLDYRVMITRCQVKIYEKNGNEVPKIVIDAHREQDFLVNTWEACYLFIEWFNTK